MVIVGGLKQDKDTVYIIVACLLHQACQAGRGASLRVSGRPVSALI